MDQNALVQRLLELTQAIEHAAAMADWPEAARLMETRTPLLHSLSAQQEPAALDVIQRIRSMDAAIAKSASTAQAELANEFQATMTRIHAVQQYNRTALI
jgi:flagellar protein FliT